MVNQSAPRPNSSYMPWPLIAGLVFALAVVGFAPCVGLSIGEPLGFGSGRLPWPLVLAGVFLSGWLPWWLLMPNWRRVRPIGGAAAGVLAATLSYPVVLGLYEAIGGTLGLTDTGGAAGVQWVAWVALLGLMTTGFALAMSFAVVGGVAAWLLAAYVRPRQVAPSSPKGAGKRFLRTARRLALGAALVVVVGLTGSFIVLSRMPIPVAGLAARASPSVPARTYEQATEAFSQVRAEEAGEDLDDRCLSKLMSHGGRTRIAVVFFHGLTSCPAQGEALANSLFARGYNVYLPRMYGHGEADPETLSLASLTAEHLVDLANQSTDLAQGLGDRVVVVGLSAGGTITTWIAQYRRDVFLAIPVSPFLGPYIVPPWANTAATNLLLQLPNMMFWVNPLAPVSAPNTGYAFVRPSTHTLGQVMRLGEAVLNEAARAPPAGNRISVLLNQADVAVNNRLTEQLVARWRSRGGAVSVHELEFSSLLPHDLINPYEIFGDTDLVYSIIAGMIDSAPQ